MRFVLYTPASYRAPDVSELWMAMMGSEAQSSTRQSRGGAPISFATGSDRAFQLQLSVQLGRIDLLVGAPQEPAQPDAIGTPVDPLIDLVLIRAEALIDSCPMHRIALVLDAAEAVADEVEAHQRLAAELPFLPIVRGVRDMNYQLNVTRPFSCDPGRTMFRLCRWSTAKVQVFSLSVDPSGAVNGVPSMVVTRDVVALQTDLSLEADTTQLDKKLAKDMLSELGDETKRIVAQGYGRLTQ